MKNTGFFTISLDFELYWGVRDAVKLDAYEEHIRNVHKLIPRLLNLFESKNISATWCIVGILFFRDKEELLQNLPVVKPTYTDPKYNPYAYVSAGNLDPIYHFAPECIRLIKNCNRQEIGTHTFSHYLCLSSGQTEEQFDYDIKKAIQILQSWEINCNSIIFPRNQYNDSYLDVCKNAGIKYYRGSEKSWYYTQSGKYNIELLFPRLLRLLDSYINISGHNTFKVDKAAQGMINIPASKFLRPYNPLLKQFEDLRFKRIANAMTFAAKNSKGYHLWWHPHNFGKYTDENFLFLGRILEHFEKLNQDYGFESRAMNDY